MWIAIHLGDDDDYVRNINDRLVLAGHALSAVHFFSLYRLPRGIVFAVCVKSLEHAVELDEGLLERRLIIIVYELRYIFM